MKLVLLTGYSCTGKTTISKLLSEREGFYFISIHAIISKIAIERGYLRGRKWFKNEGIQSISKILSEFLCSFVKQSNEDKIVIDDIYDLNLLNSINENFPNSKSMLIALKSMNSCRLNRMSERAEADITTAESELKLYDSFKFEAGIEAVIEKADFFIMNTELTIGEIYKKIINIINQYKF